MDINNKTSTKPEYKSKSQQVIVEGWELCSKMNKLALMGKRADVVEEVKTQLKLSVKYKLTKLSAEFSTFLQYHYSNIELDSTFRAKYTEMALHYNECSFFENLASIKFAEMSAIFNKTKKPSESQIRTLELVCQELKGYLKYDSIQIFIFANTLLNKLSYLKNELEIVSSRSKEAIDYLEKHKIERTYPFYYDLTVSLIRQGELEMANISIKKAISGINKTSTAWSVFLYYQLIIELHQGNYQTVSDLLALAESRRHLNKGMQETWYIVKGYMKFLVSVGLVKGASQFKIGKFLNSIEIFKQDKSGQNINVIILRVILRLGSERELIIDEREAVDKYASRYLDKGSRGRLFFKMLHQLVPGNFQKNQVAFRAKKYVKQMPKDKGYDPDLEIIPYEHLWKIILDQLD